MAPSENSTTTSAGESAASPRPSAQRRRAPRNRCECDARSARGAPAFADSAPPSVAVYVLLSPAAPRGGRRA